MFPLKKDYSYIPNAVANINRSRIDFFLITSNLIPGLKNTDIEQGRLTTLFDHRLITLQLGNKRVRVDKNKICNGVLDNKIIELTVEISVKEHYLNNTDPEAVPRFVINPIRYEIGRIYRLLKLATDLELSGTAQNELNQRNLNDIAEWKQQAHDIAETLPNIEYFTNLPLAIDPANFFEGLIMAVKNEILSKQATIYKIKNHKKNTP
jgi:hypothetical protein